MLSMETACEELTSNEQVKRSKLESQPQLQEPKKGVNARASMMEAFSSIRKILGENNINELRNQLHQLNIESDALRQHGDALLDSFVKNTEKLQQAEKDVNAIRVDHTNTKNELEELTKTQTQQQNRLNENKQALASKTNALDFAKASLSGIPKPPKTADDKQDAQKLTQLIEQLTTEVNELKQQGGQLTTQLAQSNTQLADLELKLSTIESNLKAAYSTAEKLAVVANSDRDVLNKFIQNAPRPVEVDGEKWKTRLLY